MSQELPDLNYKRLLLVHLLGKWREGIAFDRSAEGDILRMPSYKQEKEVAVCSFVLSLCQPRIELGKEF